MLPAPRRRLDPDVVRARLRAIASAGFDSAPPDLADDLLSPRDAEPPSVTAPVVLRSALRPVVIAIAATAVTVWLVLQIVGAPTPAPVQVVGGTPIPTSSAHLATPSPAPSASLLVVQVIGDVRAPGLVRLRGGSRVADAVAAAGGLTRAGASGGLNLARPLVDGEQIVVSPSTAPQASGPAPGASTGSGGDVVVDLNTATVTDLDTLPGVGPVMAGRIVEWRDSHGRFTSLDQLREVSGIGARTFERLKPHVRI